jgi:hypothetical protein
MNMKSLKSAVSILAICSLMIQCCDSDPESSTVSSCANEEIKVLCSICDGLVAQGFADRCGAEASPCGYTETGCVQISDVDVALGPDNPVNASTTELPRDMVALFGMIDFLPEEAVDAIQDSGIITWGDPSAEGEPYLEIDMDRGEYNIESGQIPNAIDPADETLEDGFYEQDVQSYFQPMGIDAAQTSMTIGDIVMSDGTQEWLMSKNVDVYRDINQIPVLNRLILSYSPDDGHLISLNGDWSILDYADSQFELKYASIDEAVSQVIAQLNEQGVSSADQEDVEMGLIYLVVESSGKQILDLLMEVRVGMNYYYVDI